MIKLKDYFSNGNIVIAVTKNGDKIKELYSNSDIISLYNKTKKHIIDYKIKRKKVVWNF